MPIDYSKWDNIDVSDSDGSDSDGGEGRCGGIAKVTRLDAPSTVTFGGGGSSNSGGNTAQQQQQTITVTTPSRNAPTISTSKTEKHSPSSSDSFLPSAEPTQAVAQPAPVTQTTQEEKAWTETGGSCYIPVVTGAGSPSASSQQQQHQQQQRKVYWSQDRYSVTITIELFDDEMKIRSVHVDGIVSYKDRFSATLTDTSSKPRLRIVATTAAAAAAAAARVSERSSSSSSSRTVVDDELPYPVHLAEEDEDSDSGDMKNDGDGKGHSIDWTIVRKTEPQPGQGQPTAISKRYVQVTLYKAVPMYGMFLWWRRPFIQCSEVDIKHNNSGNSLSEDTSTNAVGIATNGNEEFLEAW
eukprot:CAMPEP_0113463134 /NCGR_PEP_ID=MMETSP0014_2-20120614/12478_1 /TAXON_ID=2857 /ORGANISM="Nitzschia sp." /LENGTH=353 /DNA_ID=CAMNT_0000355073 /DNA_START=143 /DNA_END=1201 /DNA_ORIENTATION=- /assembly_acc=CAM_ASM_000159